MPKKNLRYYLYDFFFVFLFDFVTNIIKHKLLKYVRIGIVLRIINNSLTHTIF